MKSTRNHKLFSRLIAHVESFWQRCMPIPSGVIVAVSGGKDSMLLLEVVAALGKKHGIKVRAVHVDHGTQAKQAMIESNLNRECERLAVELTIARTELDLLASNFEAKARSLRLKLLQQNTKPDEYIVFGHHIDDSYEWAWLQSLRAGSLNPTLGIPVINRRRFRPFMCLTRAQIESIHKKLGLWHFEDESNANQRFARNHLRALTKTAIAPRYPKYLRHYVMRSNELASRLNVSAFRVPSDYRIIRHDGVIVLFCSKLRGHEELVLQLYKELSSATRSSVRKEIAKLANAMERGRQGPHQLPGGVQAWFFAGALMLTNGHGLERLRLQWSVTTQIPEKEVSSPKAVLTAVWQAPAWIKKIALKDHPLVSKGNHDVVLLPWSRFVKIDTKKLAKLRFKHLNI